MQDIMGELITKVIFEFTIHMAPKTGQFMSGSDCDALIMNEPETDDDRNEDFEETIAFFRNLAQEKGEEIVEDMLTKAFTIFSAFICSEIQHASSVLSGEENKEE